MEKRKIRWAQAAAAFLCLVFLGACGREEAEYYEIRAETEQLEKPGENQFLLGRQFYLGEAVSLVSEPVSAKEPRGAMNIYLCREGKERELLLSGVAGKYRTAGWYLDEKGRCLIAGDGVIRLDGEGNELYHSRAEGMIKGICQPEGGNLFLLISKGDGCVLAELNPDSGVITEENGIALEQGTQYIGSSGKSLMLLDGKGFWKLDVRQGKRELVLSFAGTAYTLDPKKKVAAFRFADDAADVIWESGKREKLARVGVEVKKVITVRMLKNFSEDTWLREQILLFNREHSDCYAVLEEPGEGEAAQDFINRTNLGLISGKSADIICSCALSYDVFSFLEKGVFLDLRPFMEASGILEEDYFPMTFDAWDYDGKIYGVNLTGAMVKSYTLDRTLLNVEGEVTVEKLVDAMLASEGQLFFQRGAGWFRILELLLQGSEDLWGMIDWEKGTCDFGGGLFAKMVRAAEKFAYQNNYDYPAVMDVRTFYFYNYATNAELERANRVTGGTLFDDGCHAEASSYHVMGISARSGNPEGAWELLAFLLGEETQYAQGYQSGFPVSRKAYDRLAQKEIEEGAVVVNYDEDGKPKGRYYKGGFGGRDLTREVADEISCHLEAAESLPVRTQPVINLIFEELSGYAAGNRSLEEAIGAIENRVGLYLQERTRR